MQGTEHGILHGEVVILPASRASKDGVGIEIMGSSDNELGGGLTGKHVDPPELLRLLDP